MHGFCFSYPEVRTAGWLSRDGEEGAELGGSLGRAFLSDEVPAVYRLASQAGSQRLPDGGDVVLPSEDGPWVECARPCD